MFTNSLSVENEIAKYRQDRINDAVKQEMAQILRDVKDPRIAGALVSITGADNAMYSEVFYSKVFEEYSFEKNLLNVTSFSSQKELLDSGEVIYKLIYELPEELIAQTPIEKRDSSRLMVLDKENGNIEVTIYFCC